MVADESKEVGRGWLSKAFACAGEFRFNNRRTEKPLEDCKQATDFT